MLLILCSSRCFGVLVCPSAWRSPHGSSLARLYNGINGFYAHMMLYNGPGIHIEFGMEQTSVPRAYQQLEKMKKQCIEYWSNSVRCLALSRESVGMGKRQRWREPTFFTQFACVFFCNSKAAAFDTPCAFCSLTLGVPMWFFCAMNMGQKTNAMHSGRDNNYIICIDPTIYYYTIIYIYILVVMSIYIYISIYNRRSK